MRCSSWKAAADVPDSSRAFNGTVLATDPARRKLYRAAARRQKAREDQELAQRIERAWALARRASDLLKEQFKATRVVVFGSLTREGTFTRWSDVDVAAWGIRPKDTLRAIGMVWDLDSEIEVNLVDVNVAGTSMLESIEREGIDL